MESRLTLTEAVAIQNQLGIREIRENINKLDSKVTQHEKLLQVNPTKPYLNSKGAALDSYQNFGGIDEPTLTANALVRHLWPNNEIHKYRICDPNSADNIVQSDCLPYSSDQDLDKIKLLKGLYFSNYFRVFSLLFCQTDPP